MSAPFFDIINAVKKKTDIWDDNFQESHYNAFMVNRGISQTPVGALFANTMNQFYELPKKAQYDFFYHGLPKDLAFSKWAKKESEKTNEELEEMVMSIYDINLIRAKWYIDNILTEEMKSDILKGKGGKMSTKTSKPKRSKQ
jgi:hypothetical protein